MLKIQQVLKKTKNKPKLAIILLAHCLQKNKEFVLTYPESKLNIWQYLKFRYLYLKLNKDYPLSYLLGKQEFYGSDFIVNHHVLIPRPETELIVDEVLKMLKNKPLQDLIIYDVGTGSGCIPISIAKKNKIVSIFASDISTKALNIARQNANKHQVMVDFKHGNLIEPLLDQVDITNKELIITANLPYLTQKQHFIEKSIKKEPKLALVSDNKDGLELYQRLFIQIRQLKEQCLEKCPDITLLCEINDWQAKQINKLANKYFTISSASIVKDLAEKKRLITFDIK